MRSKAIVAILIVFLLMPAMARSTAGSSFDGDLAQAQRLSIPLGDQCTVAQPQLILGDFEDGMGGVTVSGAAASMDKSSPMFGKSSLAMQLSGTSQASVKLSALNADPLRYTGVVVWMKPSVDGIKVSLGVIAKNGAKTSRAQTLRYSGEAQPVYLDFAGLGVMSRDLGPIDAVILTIYPASGGTLEVDNIALADASYGSPNRAWWDEGYSKHFVDQRYLETLNDYLSLYTLKGHSEDYKTALIRGVDNIILSRQPDGWVEGQTTGLITAGTVGATLANVYTVLKDDPAMSENIDVYGDFSHSRRWWIEKTLDMDNRFIDYIFTTDPNSWIVRNQLLEGARATYCAYLATGNQVYLNDYRNMMQTIKEGRQDPIGIYPEWTGTYDPSEVMYDASYSGVQFSTLMSLAALGDEQYALPMAKDFEKVLENAIDPKTGMIMNLNSSRKTLEGDLRWQDGMLYYLGTKYDIPGMVHLGYLENKVAPGKFFPENFHSALARYYDLKYYVEPAADNGYRLPLEYPEYSIDILDVHGNVISMLPASIGAGGAVRNPQPTRQATTFLRVNGFAGSVLPQQDVKAYFSDGAVRIEGSGPVTIKADDARLSYSGSVNGVLELTSGGPAPTVMPSSTSAPAQDSGLPGVYPLAVGTIVVILSCISAFMLWKSGKAKK